MPRKAKAARTGDSENADITSASPMPGKDIGGSSGDVGLSESAAAPQAAVASSGGESSGLGLSAGSSGGAEISSLVGQKRGREQLAGDTDDAQRETDLNVPGIVQGGDLTLGVGHGLLKQVIYTVPHPPKASDIAGLRIEVAARYSVPPENVRFLTAGSREELGADVKLDTLREPFRAWVKQSNGGVHEWAFWFTHAGAHEAGESTLVHGSASVAKVMADIEEQANAALDGLSAAVATSSDVDAAGLSAGAPASSGINEAVASEGPGPGAGELGGASGAPSNEAAEGIDAAGGGSGSGIASGSLPSGGAGNDAGVDPVQGSL